MLQRLLFQLIEENSMENIAICSEQGARDYNEDCVNAFECDGTMVFLISDGMGGYEGGEFASKAAIDTISNCFRLCSEFSVENIQKIMDAANQSVLDLQKDGGKMKATLVAAFFKKDKAIIAHAGDSRCYIFSRYHILYETKDHSVPRMAVEMGELKEKDIRTSPDRNKVLRSLGNGNCKVEIKELNLNWKKIKGILLCTDGFWQNVLEKDMLHNLRKCKNSNAWLQSMEKILVKKQDDKQDNYSAIAMKGWIDK